MIKSVKISGYKSLQDSEISFDAPLTAIVGRNNVGKSNLFDALKLLSGAVLNTRTAFFDDPRGGGLEIFSSPDNPVIKFEITLDLSDAQHPTSNTRNPEFGKKIPDCILEYQLEIAVFNNELVVTSENLIGKTIDDYEVRYISTNPLDTTIASRVFGQGSNATTIVYSRPGVSNGLSEDRAYAVPRPLSVLASIDDPDQFPFVIILRRELTSWQFYHFEPSALREPTLGIGTDGIRSNGRGLSAFLYGMERTDKELFQYVEEALRVAIPEFKHVKFIEWGTGHLLALEDKNGRAFTARVLSDGVLRFLAIIAFAHSDVAPGLICLEEPENGVHPRQLYFIVEMLRAAARRKTASGTRSQVLITSHSPYLVDLLEPEELVLAEKAEDSDRTLFYLVGDILERKKAVKKQLERGEQNLGELWSQGSLSINNGRKIKLA